MRLATVLLAVFLLAPRADAEQLLITSVHPDAAAGVLVIDGTGFRSGLYVGLEDADLKVLSVSGHEIKAKLPALKPGSYRLVLRRWRDDYARFIVTLGGTGVAGSTGPQGPSGTAGATGSTGMMGPTGPQGPQGPAGATTSVGMPGLTVMAFNGTAFGTVVSVTKFTGTDPVMVARRESGTWLSIAIDANGVVPGSFPIFFTGDGCSGDAYAMFESSPVPLFRMVQRMVATDATAFYPGNPAQMRSFPSMQMEDPANPGTKACVSTAAYGWSGQQFVGPLQTIDLAQFPAPFSVQ